jgi:hypothetical protein
MNTCMLVVVKTANAGLIGWHASVQYDTGGVFSHKLARIKKAFDSIKMEDLISGFIVPGDEREANTLDLKRTCKSMRARPWGDNTKSRKFIMSFLNTCVWGSCLEIMEPVESYRDFVVFDTLHTKPFVYSDFSIFMVPFFSILMMYHHNT